MAMNRNWIFDIRYHEKKIYSQAGQDGVIEYIFNNISTKNTPPFCVEFGFNSKTLDGGTGANVANLVKNKKWECLLIDGTYENLDINLHKHFLTSSNICSVFKEYDVPEEPEYISIDVDSTDLWLFKAVLLEYRPMVVSVEYNALFSLGQAITVENKVGLRKRRGMYGASLTALSMVGKEYGYSFVYAITGLDAFFIRDDLIKSCNSVSIRNFGNKTGINVKTPIKRTEKGCRLAAKLARNFLDYNVYVKTGNVMESKQKAFKICRESLLGNIERL